MGNGNSRKQKLSIIVAVFLFVLVTIIAILTRSKIEKEIIPKEELARLLSYEQITDENAEYADENNRVIFSAFFTKDLDGDGYAEKMLGTCNKTSERPTMYINIGVKSQGYLKDGAITLKAKDGSVKNYKFSMSMLEDDVLNPSYPQEYVSADVRKINLKRMNAGIHEMISGEMISSISVPEAYSSIAEIVLTGTYIDEEDGIEEEINKPIDVVVDWYGTARTKISSATSSYEMTNYTGAGDVNVSFKVLTKTEGLLQQSNVIEAELPELYGVYPTVLAVENAESYSYDEGSHILTIHNSAGTSTNVINLKYSKDMSEQLIAKLARDAEKSIYVELTAYSNCYNNPNGDFDNPYVTDRVSTRAKIQFYKNGEMRNEFSSRATINEKEYLGNNQYGWSKERFLDLYDEADSQTYDYSITTSIHRESLYEQPEIVTINEDTVPDTLLAVLGEGGYYENIGNEQIVTDDGSIFIVDSEYQAREGHSSAEIKVYRAIKGRKYEIRTTSHDFGRYYTKDFVTIKSLYFGETSAIKNDGYIRVYNDDTNELIKEFKNGEWVLYSRSTTPYTVGANVRQIRIETSEDDNTKLGQLTVVFNKQINMDELKQQVSSREELENIANYTDGAIFTVGGTIHLIDRCILYTEKSYSNLEVLQGNLTVGDVNKEITLKIKIPTSIDGNADLLYSPWVDGTFLVKIPKEKITKLDVQSVTSNLDYVDVDYYYCDEDSNYYYLRINSKNNRTEQVVVNGEEILETKGEKGFAITVNCRASINPISGTSSQNIELYSYNKAREMYYTEVEDIYDLDGDGRLNDYVGYDSTRISIQASSNFVATQSLTNYDSSEVVQEIFAPNTVEVKTGTRQATVNVLFVNNYKNDITNLKILGKIPFEGNTYFDGVELKSTYSSTMSENGITLPESLRNNATVYYSENANPTDDVADSSNNWKLKENVQSFENIKTYLIVVNSKLNKGELYRASYNVEIPEDVASNKVSFACFKASFDMYTDGGLLPLSVQPTKIGIKMVEYYDFEVKKLKEGTLHPAEGARYSLTEEDEFGNEANQRIVKSNEDGYLSETGLIVNQTYYLREIDGGNYETDTRLIKFRVVSDNNGGLRIERLADSETFFDGDVTFRKNIDNRHILISEIKDVPRVHLQLNKKDAKTGEAIPGVSFVLETPTEGRVYKTDSNGKVDIYVSSNINYTLKEIEADGYYLNEDIQFKVASANGIYSVESDSEVFENATVVNTEGSDYIDISIDIENYEIPTYSLKIKKVDNDRNSPLEGAGFSIEEKDTGKIEYYTTDENGNININNLYEYVAGKEMSGEYTLQEISTARGYALNDNPLKFYVVKDVDNSLNVVWKNEENLECVKSISSTEDEVTITISNNPLFKLIKINSENNERLSNVQFILYVLNDDNQEEDYAKNIYGEYVGSRNENGEYIITTDENGEIALALPDGNYKVVEYATLDGYEEKTTVEYFTIAQNPASEEEQENSQTQPIVSKIIHINYIEDLVDLQKSCASGKTYAGYNVFLDRNLDFENTSSYKDSLSKVYGDLNKNGIVETIKEELTDRDGIGFTPIENFAGNFDGQGFVIDNIYEKVIGDSTLAPYSSYQKNAGLFGKFNGSKIRNLGVSGEYYCEYVKYAAGIVAVGGAKFENCHSDVDITINNGAYQTRAAGICSGNGSISDYKNPSVINCYNTGDITINSEYEAYADGIAPRYVEKCYNTGDINVSAPMIYYFDLIHVDGVSGIGYKAKNCYNRGDIKIDGKSSYQGVAYGIGIYAENCYNTGDIELVDTVANVIDAVGAEVENGYYLSTANITTTGLTTNGIGKTESYMQTQDFVNDLSRAFWQMDADNNNNGYPVLLEAYNYVTEVNYIEDLLRLSMDGSKSITYGKMELKRTLDFNNNSSYREYTDTSYGDLNGDGIVEGVKEELTKLTGSGFSPINSCTEFDGNNYEIKNLYMNTNNVAKVALFTKGTVKNLGVTGKINANNAEIVAVVSIDKAINCYSDTDLDVNNTDEDISVYGVSREGIFNYNLGDINVRTQSSVSVLVCGVGYTSNYCYNRGNIDVEVTNAGTAEVYGIAKSSSNSYTTGDIDVEGNINTLKVSATGETSTNSYYCEDCVINANSVMSNGIQKTSAYMKQSNFISDLNERYWRLDASENDGYPILKDESSIQVSQINYIEDLVDLSLDVSNTIDYNGEVVRLMRNLDFQSADSYRNANDTSYGDINENGTVESLITELTTGKGFNPIGNWQTDHYFRGNFDGQQYTIANLYVTNRYSSGLFGCVNSSNIKNVTVTGIIEGNAYTGLCAKAVGNVLIENCINYCNIIPTETNNSAYSAGVVGSCQGELTIKGCKNYGNIKGYRVAGIASEITGNVNLEDCENYGKMEGTGSDNVGGLVGLGQNGISLNLYNCHNYNEIVAQEGGTSNSVGGLIGRTGSGGTISIKNSSNEAKITSNRYYVGGLIGDTQGSVVTISNSYNTGNLELTSSVYVGGLVAESYASVTVSDSYNSGNITDTGATSSSIYMGGILGNASGGSITNSYNSGNITSNIATYVYVGGILGSAPVSIYNSYNTGNVGILQSTSAYAGGIAGKSNSISYSYNTGNVDATSTGSVYVGGIVGMYYSSGGSVAYSYNEGKISANTDNYLYAGGITGYMPSVTYSYNKNEVSVTGKGSKYVGGIVGYCGGTVTRCYNTDSIIAQTNTTSSSTNYIGGVAGLANNVVGSHNTGIVNNSGNCGSGSVLYIGGVAGSGNASLSYNTAKISNSMSTSGIYCYVAGITGSGTIQNTYNTGSISNNMTTNGDSIVYVGGLAGMLNSGNNVFSYNTGKVNNNVADISGSLISISGPIYGSIYGNNTSTGIYHFLVYPKDLEVTGDNINYDNSTAKTDEYMRSTGMYNTIKQGAPNEWKQISNQYPVLDVPVLLNETDVTEVTVENTPLEYNITTGIGKNSEGDRAGGTITGTEDGYSYIKTVETVAYGDASTKAIEISPTEEYDVVDIKINGENYDYNKTRSNSIVIPVGYFNNVTQDYYVEATFERVSNILNINKVDSQTGEAIEGAVFDIHEVDTRPEVTNAIGTLVNDGEEYAEADLSKQANDLLGTVTHNSSPSYYFRQQSDGTYVSNNTSATKSIAESYAKIDLSQKTGSYTLEVSMTASSYYYGYAKITESTSSLNATTAVSGYFLRVGGNSTVTQSVQLEAGRIYYVHFAHNRTGTSNPSSYQNKITINSINLYENSVYTPHFELEDGKYVSKEVDNHIDSKYATSYIPIDLTGYTGKYNVTINAEKSSKGSGYIIINQSPNRITSGSNAISIAPGEANYTQVLQGGEMYYMHLSYAPTRNTDGNEMKVNSIQFSKNEDDLYNATGLRTNSRGQVAVGVHYGTYNIVETEAPTGYILNETPVEYVVSESSTNQVNIQNEPLKVVIAHYYVNGTGAEFGNEPVIVAEDEYLYGMEGERYTTKVQSAVGNYELIKENNLPVIPGNAIGNFGAETINVYYYYEVPTAFGSYKLNMTKLREDDRSVVVEGAEFDVYENRNGSLVRVGKLEDNGNGLYTTENIAIQAEGNISLVVKETVVPEGYEQMNDLNISLNIVNIQNVYVVESSSIGTVETTDESGRNVISGEINEPLKTLKYEVHYFKDGIECEELKETNLTAKYGSVIDSYPDKLPRAYVFDKAMALDETGNEVDLPLTIGLDEEKNVINVYYEKIRSSFKFDATKVNSADNSLTVEGAEFEVYRVNGASEVKIGTISDEGNGQYSSENIEVSEEGTVNIKIKETVTPTEYKKVDDIVGTISFEFDENNQVYIISDTSLGIVSVADENSNNNTIRMTIEEPYDDFAYTVHYFYDGTEDESKKVEETAVFRSTITEVPNKVIEGYKQDRVETLPLTVTANEANNVVNVYYVKDSFKYTVHYFYDGTEDENKKVEETAVFGSTITEVPNKVIEGYKQDRVETLPLTITANEANNVVNVYYVKDSFKYTVHYFYDGTEDEDKKVEETAVFGSTITEVPNKVIEGYKQDRVETLPLTISANENDNVVNVYYVKDSFKYTVHYFYDGTEDEDKKVEETAVFGSTITEVPNKVIEGYKQDRIETLPLTITANEANNVVNVYYVKDSFKYTVHYFYDGTEDEDKKVEETAVFESTITEVPNKVIEGYKQDRVETLPLTITAIEDDNVVNVYYVKDSFKYTVHYFYDGTEDESKKVEETAVFGSTIMEVPNKVIEGYKQDRVETLPLTITATEDDNVVNVYYVKDSFKYTVHYFYDGTEDEDKKVEETAVFESTITEVPNKVIEGYKQDRVETLPLTITAIEDDNVVNVYYVKDSFKYTVHYFYDGTEDETKKVESTAVFGSTITEVPNKAIEGYKQDRVDTLPLTITATEDDNVVNVYYVKDSFKYTVHYFYDGTEDETKKVESTAVFGSTITEVPNKVIEGYKQDRIETLPLTITAIEDDNVVNVYYVKDSFKYTVHYFYDGTEDESKKVESTAVFGATITEVPNKNIEGYKEDRIETLPLTISATEGENVVNVYYVKDSFKYTVHYFYDGTEDESKKVESTAVFGATITEVPNKNIEGYKEDRIETLPLTITATEDNNVVNVYYVKDSFKYTVHYFYDGTEDESKKVESTAVFGATITEVPNKNIEGYKEDRIETLPLTISATEGENVVNVYYVKDSFKYTVHYFYDGTEDESKKVESTAVFGATITEVPNKNIEGYKEDRVETLPLTITATEDNNVVNVYYVKDSFKYTVHYFYDGTEDESKKVESTAVFGATITEVPNKNIEGYKEDRVETLPLTITATEGENVVNVYYVKDSFKYTVHYFYDGTEDESKKVESTAVFGTTITEVPNKNIEGYKEDRVETLPLTITATEDNNVVNVYYVKDSFKYTVHYFYDGTEDESKKVESTAVFGATITEVPNKNIEGYKEDRIETLPLTITATEDNNVVNVYYVKDSFKYTVHYFYDGTEDESKKVESTAVFGATITEVPNKNIEGYKEDRVETLPLTITATEDNNVVNVYYVKDSFKYTVHYFYDGTEDESKKVESTAVFGATITEVPNKNIEGYTEDRVETLPLTITATEDNNVVNVYYVKDSFKYTVHYFYDGTEDESKKVESTAVFGATITEVPNKNIEGYKEDRVETLPLTITATEGNNVVNVYYVKDSFKYTVHYFYDGTEDESKKVESTAAFGSTVTEVPNKNIEGYKLEKSKAINDDGTEGELPLVIKSDESKNIINVYYIKAELGYEIHYFYDGIEDELKQENKNSTIGEQISTYTDKIIEGYKLDKEKAVNDEGEEDDLPLIVKADESKNIINVYYEKDEFNYEVHYFYDGIEDESKAEKNNKAIFESEITQYTDKNIEGYKIDKVKALNRDGREDELPLIIKADESKNIINVYYKNNTGKITVKYTNNLTGEEIIPEFIMHGPIGENYTVERANIPGYRLDVDNIPTNETGIYTAEGETVTYKYIELKEYELLVKYSAGTSKIEDAKIAVKFGDTFIDDYTTNGLLKIGNLELTDLGTVAYTVYESETPEYCTTVVSKENPAVVELIRQLNTEKNKYEFVANYDNIEGFEVLIDDENEKVIFDITTEKRVEYDLALQKFISKIDRTETTNREPQVLIDEGGKIQYIRDNKIEQVANNQMLTYTLRIYNESKVSGLGNRIIEFIPDGLVFIPQNETNKEYQWKLYKLDENANLVETTDIREATVIATDYLKDKNIEGFDATVEKTPKYVDVKVVFMVDENEITSEDRTIENSAEIKEPKEKNSEDGIEINPENNTTSETVYVKYFDLDVTKYIKEITVKNGAKESKKEVGESKKGQLIKIDVAEKDVENTIIRVTYVLKVKNIGEIEGYATELADYIPANFKLVEDGIWNVDGDRTITTALKDTLLQPGESTTIEITFDWNLSSDSIGSRINKGKIVKYSNPYNAKDPTENNEDSEEMLVEIKTGKKLAINVMIAVVGLAVLCIVVATVKLKLGTEKT